MRNTLSATIAVLLLTVPYPSLAQQSEEKTAVTGQTQQAEIAPIIERVKRAYGGRNLENLKSVRIQNERGLAWPGQGQTASFVEYVRDKFDVHIDLVNQRASQERWIEQNGNIYSERYVSGPEGGVASINYSTGTYEIDEEGSFMRNFGVELTTSDTLIAYFLTTDPHNMVLEEPAYYLGKWHDRLTFGIAPDALAFAAYIDRNTGLITRTEIALRSGTWNTLFSDFQTSRGLTYARKRMDFRDDIMVQTYADRQYTFNKVRWSDLEIEDYLTEPPEQVDSSEMTVDKISQTMHFVGQHNAYSAFVDAGDYIIGLNAYAGFKDRYEAYQKDQPTSKPLHYVLITHHHDDHLGGISEAAETGATIVGTPMTIKLLESDEQFETASLQTLKKRDQIGPVQTYTVPTSHVAEYAVMYLPDGKVIYQDDHYNPTVKDGPSHVNQTGLVLQDRIEELGLDVNIILSGHARKAEKWADFEIGAAKEALGDICPRNRKICHD